MPEIKNAFIKGKMNKDLDERLVPNGQYRDALNIDVDYSEGSDVGALKNILGNTQKDSISLSDATCIGSVKDTENDKIYWFITSSAKDIIAEYDVVTSTAAAVIVDTGNILKFNTNNLITGVNVLDSILYFTDNLNEPKQVDIAYWKTQTSNFNSATTGLSEERITVIKKSPMQAPTLNMQSSLRTGAGTQGGASVTSNLLMATSTGSGLANAKTSGTILTNQTFSTAPNYQVNDVIIIKFEFTDSTSGEITKTEARLKITAISGTTFSAEILTTSKQMRAATVAYSCLLQEDEPLFQLKFPRFAYRYKYDNGQYSCFSPFSNAAFLPDSTVGSNSGFEYNAEDGFNLAMVNTLRSLELQGLNNNISADVKEIDVIYKDSVGNNCYVVDTIKRQANNSIASTFQVKDEQIFKVLPSNQLLRLFDSVPKKAKAQDITANRLIYGNFTHQFDLPLTPVQFDIKLKNRYASNASNRAERQSIKSNRTYQFGVVYTDTYGRQTPVLTDKTGIIKVPQGEAKNMTKFTAKVTSSAPSFATNYKYFIKEISSTVHNLCADSFYQDKQGYMYVAFPSSEINKVNIDDILLLKKKSGSEFSDIEDKFKVLDKLTTPPPFLAKPKKEFYRPEHFAFSVDYENDNDQTTIKPGSTPVPNKNRVTIRSMNSVGDLKIADGNTFAGGADIHGVSRPAYEAVSPGKFVKFIAGDSESDIYEVKQKEVNFKDNDDIELHFKTEFGNDVASLYEDFENNPDTTALKGGVKMIAVEEKDESGKAEFAGRFFLKLKADTNLLTQLKGGADAENFEAISTISLDGRNDDDERGFQLRFGGKANTNSASFGINQSASSGGWDGWGESNPGEYSSFPSSVISDGYHFAIETDRTFADAESFYGSHPFIQNLKEGNYIQFNRSPAQITANQAADNTFYKIETVFKKDNGNSNRVFAVKLNRNLAQNLEFFTGSASQDDNKIFQITVYEVGSEDLINIVNPPIFEVEPQDDVDIDLYFETQEDLTIASNHGNENSLLYYNCFSFENGVESFIIRDDFNAPALGKGVRVSTIFEDNYQEENLKSDLIFSQIYNGKTGVNRLNQFIIAEPITKQLNPDYGSIQLLHTRYNDIIAYCEDKVLKILTNKDALFNADGNVNVTSNKAVLGQAMPYNSNYGIGTNPESFSDYTFRSYFVDKKNGVVVRHSLDGMEEISNFGMKDYFKDNLRAQTGFIHGSYDEKKNQYNVSLPISVNNTVSYAESIKGWPSRKSFVFENGLSMNNKYFTFKNGHIFEHHIGTRNTFYGVKTDSEVTFLLNQSPANMKNFRTLNYEGDTGWTCDSIVTDQQDGSISSFIKKENKYYNYISGVEETESTIDLKALNVQGLGAYTSQAVVGSNRVFTFNFELNNDMQIGDKLYYVDGSSNKQDLGKITAINKTNKTVTIVNTSEVPQASAYMFYAKNAKFYTSGLLGYFAETKFKNTSTDSKELYSVGSEISISS